MPSDLPSVPHVHNTPSGNRVVSTPNDLAIRDAAMESELQDLQTPQSENPNVQQKSMTFRDRLGLFYKNIDLSALNKNLFDYEPRYLAEELVMDHLREVRDRMRLVSSVGFGVLYMGVMWHNRYHFGSLMKGASLFLFWGMSWKLADLELTPYAIKFINK